MIKLVNESTGKTALTIKDNGDMVVEGNVTVESETEVKEAFKAAQTKG